MKSHYDRFYVYGLYFNKNLIGEVIIIEVKKRDYKLSRK